MSLRRRYRTQLEDRFNELILQRRLAGLQVEAMPPVDMQDRYLDTAEGTLLAQGLLLRLRIQDATVRATLRTIEGEASRELVHERFPPDALGNESQLPAGHFRDTVERFTKGAPLDVLLRFRQYRTPRALYEDGRLIGVLALDVVADQTAAGQPVVSNEVELELLEEAGNDLLERIEAELREAGVVAEPLTKFEHGIFRLTARENERILLLPRERKRLEALSRSETSVEQRRAQAILLAADGLDLRAVSREVGLAPSRIRHWCETFRTDRMRLFDPEEVVPELEPAVEGQPAYIVSELVGDVVRIDPDPWRRMDLDTLASRLRDRLTGEKASGDGISPIEPESEAGRASAPPLAMRDRPAVARGVDLEHPLGEWARMQLRETADDLARTATSVAEGDHQNVLHPALEMCRRVPSIALLLGTRQGEPLYPPAREARAIGGVLVELITLRDTLFLLKQIGDVDDDDSAQLGRALARSVWNVELQRLVNGYGGSPALSAQLKALAEALETIDEEQLAGAADLQLQHVLASETWRRYETLRRRISQPSLGLDPLAATEAAAQLANVIDLLPSEAAAEASATLDTVGKLIDRLARHHTVVNRVSDAGVEWSRAGGLSDSAVLDTLRSAAIEKKDAAMGAAADGAAALVSPDFRLLLGWATAAV